MDWKPRLIPILLAMLPAGLSFAADTDAVSAASPRMAWPMDPAQWAGAEGPHAEAVARWRDELGLSVEQQAIMGEIVADYANRLRPLVRQGLETGWSIVNIAPMDPEYTTDTETAAQSAAQTAAGIVRLLSEMRSAVQSVMTPEQIATLDRLLTEERERWRSKLAEAAAKPAAGDGDGGS